MDVLVAFLAGWAHHDRAVPGWQVCPWSGVRCDLGSDRRCGSSSVSWPGSAARGTLRQVCVLVVVATEDVRRRTADDREAEPLKDGATLVHGVDLEDAVAELDSDPGP